MVVLPKYSQFILVGDSITEQGWWPSGWVNTVTDTYNRKVDVVNRGFGGWNTRWWDYLIPGLFTEKVLFMSIFLGANDAALPPHKSHVPLVEYKKNLSNMIEQVQTLSPQTQLLIVSPPPVQDSADRKNKITLQYRDACIDISNQYHAACLDTYTVFEKEDMNKAFRDGLHFSPYGNQVFARAFLAKIKQAFPELAPEQLEFVYSPWENVDNNRLPQSLWPAEKQRDKKKGKKVVHQIRTLLLSLFCKHTHSSTSVSNN